MIFSTENRRVNWREKSAGKSERKISKKNKQGKSARKIGSLFLPRSNNDTIVTSRSPLGVVGLTTDSSVGETETERRIITNEQR